MADIKKCTGLTKTSKPCNNKAIIGKDFCQVHLPKDEYEKIKNKEKKEYKKAEGNRFKEEDQCKGLTKSGAQCKRKGIDGLCDKHKKSLELAQLTNKTCRICKKTKDISEFRKNRGECVDCERGEGRKYRQDNKEIAKKWTEDHKEQHDKLKSDWAKSHREHINKKHYDRYTTDEDYRKVVLYRKRVQEFLGNRRKTTCELLDCDEDTFRKWISFCFKENMTVENYGDVWVGDHVIPINEEKEEFETIAKWFNIMPVDKKYNLKKNKYIDKEQLKTHLSNLEKFCDENNIQRDEKYFSLLAKHLDVRESLDF